MAPMMSLSVNSRSTCSINNRLSSRTAVAVPRPAAFLVPTVPRSSIIRFSSDTGAENDEQLVSDKGEILQGHQEMKTMAEGERGQTSSAEQEQQQQGGMGSPEAGDTKSSDAQGASEAVQEEASQQQDRPPLRD